jgi:hypothetical protein
MLLLLPTVNSTLIAEPPERSVVLLQMQLPCHRRVEGSAGAKGRRHNAHDAGI